MKRFGILLIAVMLGLVLACGRQEAKAPAARPPQVARMEIHAFPSLTLTDQEFLTCRKEGKPVTISGELRLPRPEIIACRQLSFSMARAECQVMSWIGSSISMPWAWQPSSSTVSRGAAS